MDESAVDRLDALDQLGSRRFDLLVVGGGIVGAGIAEAASAHGLSVALVDKGDFGGATSSASSKLVHGGLRYLRLGDVGLVREAHHERRILMTVVAPHLVGGCRSSSRCTTTVRSGRGSSRRGSCSTRRSRGRA